MVMSKQTQTKLEIRLAKLEKENLKKEKEISRKEKENQRLKAKQAKEISRLKSYLGREIPRLKTMLAEEDSLWNTELGQKKHSSALPTRLLHTHEMLEYIISDEKMIKALTKNTKEVFDDTLEDLS